MVSKVAGTEYLEKREGERGRRRERGGRRDGSKKVGSKGMMKSRGVGGKVAERERKGG